MTRFGYAGVILAVDLSAGKIERLPSAPYTERVIAGRGIAAKIYWDTASFSAGALEPGNCLIYATGPVTAFPGIPGGSRWQVCGKSPLMEPQLFAYANLGERWGTRLKLAGYDGLVVRGKTEKPVYIYISNDTVEIRDASDLWGKGAFQSSDALKAALGQDFSILTIGQAAEHLVSFASMLTDDGSSGACGFGAVMGSKNLKAIAVAGNKKPLAYDTSGLGSLTRRILELRRDTWKDWHDNIPGKTSPRPCYGCTGCFRKAYMENGRRYKFFCQSVHVYSSHAEKYDSVNCTAPQLLAMRLCDDYGLDTVIMQPYTNWLAACYAEGILTEKETGLPLAKIGSAEFIEALCRKIAYREGFGELLAQGTIKATAAYGKRSEQIMHDSAMTRGGENRDYDPRQIPHHALLYATEQRRPINQTHEAAHSLWMWRNWKNNTPGAFLTYEDLLNIARTFWGSEAAADYTTLEGKALAAKKIQDRTYAKESLVLCDFLWPIIWTRFTPGHKGVPSMESQLLSAITGIKIDEAGLNKLGETVFNLQRSILLRHGWQGRQDDTLMDFLFDEPLDNVFNDPECIVAGKGGEVISRRGVKLDRMEFENLKDEYYALRGWDITTGYPTGKKLNELGLGDVAAELKAKNLSR